MENEKQEEVDPLAHLHVKVRTIFGHETTQADYISRNEKGNIVSTSDVFSIAKDSRNPEWQEHKFGMCKLRAGSLRWDEDEEEYVLELTPLRPRYVMVPMVNEETGERYLARRKERTITVIATQAVPNLAVGVPREQRDAFSSGLMGDRRRADEAAAKAAAKADGTGTKKKRKGRVLSATVSGSLISELLGGKVQIFRVGGGKEPEAVFDATPEGFGQRDAYLEEYADAPPPAPEASDDESEVSE